jgi:hypothetical protein
MIRKVSRGRATRLVPVGHAVFAGLVLLIGQTASGEAADDQLLALWEFRFAAFARYAPVYPGSAEYDLNMLPIPYPVYRGKRLRFGEDIDSFAEGRIVRGPRARLDVNFNLNFGEDSENIPVRRGMPDLDPLIEVGPELEIKLNDPSISEGDWLLALQARAAISSDGSGLDGRGFLLNPELEYRIDQAFGSHNDWSFSFKSTWASEDFAAYYYGVAPEFATPTRRGFDASAGYLGSVFRVGLERQISPRMRFDGSARVWFNHGAKNSSSPLFQDDLGVGIQGAFIWTLAASKRRGD